MNKHAKHYHLLKVFLFLFAALHLSGCAFTGKSLTTGGVAYEPQVAWNGSHFGIIYLQSSTPGAWPNINMVKVDKNANIIASKPNIGAIPHNYVPYLISELVWNGDNNQFAFAYTKGKVIHFIRLDANLNVIGSPLEIKFNVPISSWEHPTLVDLSLVWNHVKKEYGLTFVTREHPYLQDRHDDIYISRISSSGTYIGPYERTHIVNCPGDCEKTSLTYNTGSGEYAFSYIKNDFPNNHVMIGLYSPGSSVNEHALMTAWNPGMGEATHILYDPSSKEYIVLALKKKSGSTNGYEISYQFAGSNGAPTGPNYVWTSIQGFDNIVSISRYLAPIKNTYLIAASEQPQIHCRMATETGFVTSDIAYTSNSVSSWHPSLSAVDATYMSWIQNETLYFGVSKK